jgi:hypothetical protein
LDSVYFDTGGINQIRQGDFREKEIKFSFVEPEFPSGSGCRLLINSYPYPFSLCFPLKKYKDRNIIV